MYQVIDELLLHTEKKKKILYFEDLIKHINKNMGDFNRGEAIDEIYGLFEDIDKVEI